MAQLKENLNRIRNLNLNLISSALPTLSNMSSLVYSYHNTYSHYLHCNNAYCFFKNGSISGLFLFICVLFLLQFQ